MGRILRRNRNLSQKLKPIIVERVSYCIQFELGTETVKILKFKKFSQASEQILIDLSVWRELESKRLGDLEKNWLCLSHLREQSTGFHMIQLKNLSMKFWIWDTEIVNSFQLLTTNPKKCFSPWRICLVDWQKIKTI